MEDNVQSIEKKGKYMKKYTKEIETIIKELTLEEKISIIHADGLFRSGAVERLSIPHLYTSDGPCGVRCEFNNDNWFPVGTDDDFVSYLPSNSAIATTWNKELAYESGKTLGEEARGRGKDMILAPGINIKRDPRCGRNFEYMSEDPKVVEEMAVPLVKGIQENDVSACVKHYAVNNQETNRMGVDTLLDDRTLREIYLKGFEAVVKKADCFSVMAGYNKFRGEHCCENKILLNDILRNEWGFDGTIVSDWGGVHSTVGTAESELDLEMSVTADFDDYFFANPLLKAIKDGEVSEELVDKKVEHILRLMFNTKMIGEDKEDRKPGAYNTEAHRKAAKDVAREALVLLKNEQNVLPLNRKKVKKLAVIGANADIRHSFGGGSAEIKALYELTPLIGLKMYLGGNTEVKYARGYHVPGKALNATESWQATSTETGSDDMLEYPYLKLSKPGQFAKENEVLFAEALEIAKDADAVIFVGGLDHNYDIEGADRKEMALPYDQDLIIEKLLDLRKDTIILLNAGSPVEMPWADKADTLLYNYYAGMENGSAIAEVIFGDVNPSGKLSESMPLRYEDTVTCKNQEFGRREYIEYKEGIFYGYRYYEKEGIKVAFPFGYGKSYTTFEYSDLKIEKDKESFTVSLTVKNTGSFDGKEVVQVYVGENKPTVDRPVKELKGFDKVFVKAGNSMQVDITIQNSDLGYYDTEKKAFVTNSGDYTVYVCASSADVRLTETVTI